MTTLNGVIFCACKRSLTGMKPARAAPCAQSPSALKLWRRQNRLWLPMDSLRRRPVSRGACSRDGNASAAVAAAAAGWGWTETETQGKHRNLGKACNQTHVKLIFAEAMQ